MTELAVIFDMDGVLVDSYDAHFVSWKRMYGEMGLDYSEAEFATDFGRTSRDILARRFGDELTTDRIREMDERKEALFRDELREHFRAMDGAVEIIDALSADHLSGGARFRLAVGSSAPPANVELCLERLGRQATFGAVVTGQDVTRGKPDPQVFLLAAERLCIAPEYCAVVEDAVHGVEAANRAGMKSIGLVGTVTRDRLAGADFVIDRLRELSPKMLRRQILG